MMIKRSLSIHGHRTSLALEAEFWSVIDKAVKQSGKSFARFIRDLDDIRTSNGTEQNLASYLRVWVLNEVQAGYLGAVKTTPREIKISS